MSIMVNSMPADLKLNDMSDFSINRETPQIRKENFIIPLDNKATEIIINEVLKQNSTGPGKRRLLVANFTNISATNN